MRITMISFLLVLISIIFTGIAYAEVPMYINYQGRITDTDGDPIPDGEYQVKFWITTGIIKDGSRITLWDSGTHPYNITDGFLEARLGEHFALPDDLFKFEYQGYLHIQIDGIGEIEPPTPLSSVPFAIKSFRADSAWNAEYLNSQPGSYYLDWYNLTNIPPDFSDGVDNGIVSVTEGSGIDAVVVSGDANISVEDDGITSNHIQDLTIMNSDINSSANIAPEKIQNTAAVLEDYNIFNDVNTFSEDVYFRGASELILSSGANQFPKWVINEEETFGLKFTQVYDDDNTVVDRDVMEMGDDATIGIGVDPLENILIATSSEVDQSSPNTNFNMNLFLSNSDNGNLMGIYNYVHHTTASNGGTCYGINTNAKSDGNDRYGLYSYCEAHTVPMYSGNSYGIYTAAWDGNQAFGIYAQAAGASTNWAGYFNGDVRVVGTLDDSKSGILIDHPQDPENKTLYHSNVNSPDMLNVYSGNVVLDADGRALVKLPDYFESLNSDYRYQLTAIGTPAPGLYIVQEISNNEFVIAGGDAGMKVSWQVSGLRNDPYAQQNQNQVELEKAPEEKGYYINPEIFGMDQTRSIAYKKHNANNTDTAGVRGR